MSYQFDNHELFKVKSSRLIKDKDQNLGVTRYRQSNVSDEHYDVVIIFCAIIHLLSAKPFNHAGLLARRTKGILCLQQSFHPQEFTIIFVISHEENLCGTHISQ